MAERKVDLGIKAKEQALKDRATGAARKLPQTPPPAKLPPGVKGNPPLPTGRAVVGISPASLTDAERQALESVGWREGVPIPSQVSEILEEENKKLAAAREVDLPLPVDPRLPPPKYEVVDINSLPSDKQEEFARVRERMTQMSTEEVAAKEAETEERRRQAREMHTPGVAQALRAADQAAQAKTGSTEPLEEDIPADKPSSTGAAPMLAVCPHCSWNLAVIDGIPEPDYPDKISFVHTLLGGKVFTKKVELLGGHLTVTFRTLRLPEVDIIYRQAFLDKSNKDLNDVDYFEVLNRYRLMLQLINLEGKGIQEDLADGYSQRTAADCVRPWINADEEALLTDRTGLPEIETWMVENVLKTEAIFRVVFRACNDFNRLVAKLEAMADNSDFWKPTEAQS